MELLNEITQEIRGLKLHLIKTDKYKTNTIILKLKAPLDEKHVTLRALLPYVLQSETKSFPSSTALRRQLDELYGATLHVDLSKKGEYHVISIKMEIANEKFLSDQTPIFLKGIQLLGEIVFQPDLENGVFKASTLEKEKRSLKQRIQSVFDDKMRYSNLRLIQEMCKNEPYHLHVNGRIEDIEKINGQSLFDYYQQVLNEDEIDLYVVGNIDETEVLKAASEYFPFSERNQQEDIGVVTSKEIKEENEVIEEQDVRQGKLNIGYRTNTTYRDADYDALQIFNGVYGGFAHSKLFINVREKESLAYYASSRLESHKGLLMVMSGVEFTNYEKAVSIIKAQMEAMKNGDFSEGEIEQTKAVIRNQLLETIDTSRGAVEVMYHNVVARKERKLEDWIAGLEAVTKEDIVNVAKKIELDTIYFLKGLGDAK